MATPRGVPFTNIPDDVIFIIFDKLAHDHEVKNLEFLSTTWRSLVYRYYDLSFRPPSFLRPLSYAGVEEMACELFYLHCPESPIQSPFTMLPKETQHKLIGSSEGHLLFRVKVNDQQYVALCNVFTGDEFQTPLLPPDTSSRSAPFKYAYFSGSNHLFVFNKLSLFRWTVGNLDWEEISLVDILPEAVIQLIKFKTRYFVVDCTCRLFELVLNPNLASRELPWPEMYVENAAFRVFRLVECDGKLLVVVRLFHWGENFITNKVFSLNVEEMIWEEFYTLGDWCLFHNGTNMVSQMFSCRNPGRWGGVRDSIYSIDSRSYHWTIDYLDSVVSFSPRVERMDNPTPSYECQLPQWTFQGRRRQNDDDDDDDNDDGAQQP